MKGVVAKNMVKNDAKDTGGHGDGNVVANSIDAFICRDVKCVCVGMISAVSRIVSAGRDGMESRKRLKVNRSLVMAES